MPVHESSMTNNTCLELWGPLHRKCGLSLHAFSLVMLIEPMKASVNKSADPWRESLNLGHYLLCLVLFRIEAQGDFSLHFDQTSPFQVAMGQRPRWVMARVPVLVWGICLSVFIVFSKVIDIYQRVDEGPLKSKPWELMLMKWSSKSWKCIKERDLMYDDSDWTEVRDIRRSCSWVWGIRVFLSLVSMV